MIPLLIVAGAFGATMTCLMAARAREMLVFKNRMMGGATS